jgi:AAA+ ATPase superfamily predicted ATPase
MTNNNPFVIQGYKSPEYFCNREKETAKIVSAIENGRNITLYSLRRVGKTGLIQNVFHQLSTAKKYHLFYVDLYPTSNLTELITSIAQAILGSMDSNITKVIQQLGNILTNIGPQISYDTLTAQPTIQLNISSEEEAKITLEKIFSYIKSQDKLIVIALDEFQQILKYPEKNIEALLRKFVQETPNARFIFSGSQQEMLLGIFGSSHRPFYQSTEMLHLDFLEKNEYSRFISKHFTNYNKTISPEIIELILEWTKGHTYYVQFICNRLFSLGENDLTLDLLKILLSDILKENEQIYIGYRNFITINQWNLLNAIAKEESIKQITSQNFLRKYNLGTPSSVKSALSSLVDKELVYYDNQVYRIYDLFFQKWLKHSVHL